MGTGKLRPRCPSYQVLSRRNGTESGHPEEGEDIDTPTIAREGKFKAGGDELNLDPRGALEKLLDVTHNTVVRQGWIVNEQSKEVWVVRKGAAPSYQRFIPCPGGRGDFSWDLQTSGD